MLYISSPDLIIEKDPNVQKLRQEIANKIWEIAEKETPDCTSTEELRFVSFEEALKELVSLKNP